MKIRIDSPASQPKDPEYSRIKSVRGLVWYGARAGDLQLTT
ncbi:MAG TPA: hypothetical protein PKB07_02260 [Flavilitoribacter sp.]|nr:hypothetical protein [Flavilitoribacter sp.]